MLTPDAHDDITGIFHAFVKETDDTIAEPGHKDISVGLVRGNGG